MGYHCTDTRTALALGTLRLVTTACWELCLCFPSPYCLTTMWLGSTGHRTFNIPSHTDKMYNQDKFMREAEEKAGLVGKPEDP